jgi:hypothetical protein
MQLMVGRWRENAEKMIFLHFFCAKIWRRQFLHNIFASDLKTKSEGMYYLCITYVKPILMAKVIIHDIPLQEAANILAQTGITLDKHQLPDGTYRAYVRKDKIPLFLSNNLKPTQL